MTALDPVDPCGLLTTEELRLHVFSYLSAKNLCAVSHVASHWRALCMTDSLWQRLCRIDFLVESDKHIRYPTWRALYIQRRLMLNRLFQMRLALRTPQPTPAVVWIANDGLKAGGYADQDGGFRTCVETNMPFQVLPFGDRCYLTYWEIRVIGSEWIKIPHGSTFDMWRDGQTPLSETEMKGQTMIYPHVMLCGFKTELIRVNFGRKPFLFDIRGYIKELSLERRLHVRPYDHRETLFFFSDCYPDPEYTDIRSSFWSRKRLEILLMQRDACGNLLPSVVDLLTRVRAGDAEAEAAQPLWQAEQNDAVIPSRYLKLESAHISSGVYGTVNCGTMRGKEVAVKQLNNRNLSCEQINALKHEVGSLRELPSHHGVVQLLGLTVDRGRVGIVMEQAVGHSLEKVIRDQSHMLTVEQQLRIAKQIAVACEWLHSQRPPFIHKDLRPSSIVVLLDNSDIKICDLGMTCLKEKHYHTKELRTSVALSEVIYSAPEVLQGGSHSTASDVYAYGFILWELFTRKNRPFHDVTDPDFFFELVTMEEARPAIPSGVPGRVRSLIQRCWAQDKDQRPSFGKIMSVMDKMIVDTLISCPAGNLLWENMAKEGESGYPFMVSWKSKAVCDAFEGMKTNSPHLSCLKEIIAIQHENKGTTHTSALCYQFGKVLSIFGGLSNIGSFVDLCRRSYYFGDISAAQAEVTLKQFRPGSFLLRSSAREPVLVVSFVVNTDDILHHRIMRTDGGLWVLGGDASTNRGEFPSVPDLVDALGPKLGFSKPVIKWYSTYFAVPPPVEGNTALILPYCPAVMPQKDDYEAPASEIQRSDSDEDEEESQGADDDF